MNSKRKLLAARFSSKSLLRKRKNSKRLKKKMLINSKPLRKNPRKRMKYFKNLINSVPPISDPCSRKFISLILNLKSLEISGKNIKSLSVMKSFQRNKKSKIRELNTNTRMKRSRTSKRKSRRQCLSSTTRSKYWQMSKRNGNRCPRISIVTST